MAAPRARIRSALLWLPLAAALGCAAPPPKVAKKPERPPAAQPTPPAPEQTPPAVAAPPAKPADPVPTEVGAAPSGKNTDVIDPGGSGSVTLVQAAHAEKERRAAAGRPVAVITDKTLPHLPKGQITYADPGKGKKRAPAAAKPDDAAAQAAEQYWRGRALDIRLRWKKAAERVKELEKSANGLRRRFYAEDDPYVRDGQVKPEWDRVLDRLGEARAEVEATRKELDDFLEEGRRGGALPGWLREGAEQEPVEKPKPKGLPTVEPKEPPVAREDGGA